MIYKTIRPLLFRNDAERMHNLALQTLAKLDRARILFDFYSWLFDEERCPRLEQTLFGISFRHPLGLAAGFDKNAIACHPLVRLLGVSHMEIGGVTRYGQDGNPTPRLFRAILDQAIINRIGFNNDGADKIARRLSAMDPLPVPLGLNIGKSKLTPIEQAETDYANTVSMTGMYADYLTVNVSSPNTPELRTLQEKGRLTRLLSRIQDEASALPPYRGRTRRPILVKLAPDLSDAELDDALEVVSERRVDGIIAVNTTVKREGLKTMEPIASETGGLSGPPLHERALAVVRHIRTHLPAMPIVGSGGIRDGRTAFEMIKAGANLLQLYTAIVYEGPSVVRRIVSELNGILRRDETTVRTYSPYVGSSPPLVRVPELPMVGPPFTTSVL